jgi:hypothetical protein
MKSFVIVLFFVLVAPTLAQAPSPNSIALGDLGESVHLALGTRKEVVLRTLRDSFRLSDLEGESFAIHSKTNPNLGYGSVSFKDGKLSSVTKYWEIYGPDSGVAVIRAIYGAISSFGGSTRTCNVTTFDDQEPSTGKKGVVISCGSRQLQVFTNRWAFKTGSGEAAVVTEVLSSEP